MDSTAESQKPQDTEPKEILIPEETAKSLGRGLNQLLKDPVEQIREHIKNLKSNAELNNLQVIEEYFKRITDVPNNLEHSKETRIIPFASGWDFKFSEEKEVEEQPIQPEIIIDETTTPKLSQLRTAMQQNFNNSFQLIMGFLERIQSEAKNPTLKEQTSEVLSRSQSILKSLKPIQNAEYQLKISTDNAGITTLTPIPNPHGQPNDMTPR